jgi:hypothetical protein
MLDGPDFMLGSNPGTENTRLPNRAADSLTKNSNVAFGRCPSGLDMRRQRWFESC